MARRRKTRSKSGSSTQKRARRTARRTLSSGKAFNFWIPLFLIVVFVSCLGILFYAGYRNVTASSFFEIRAVETVGAHRVSGKRIEQLVRSRTYRSGVFNADLDRIKSEIEKMKLVKHASVSKVLPDTIRVVVREREARAVARIGDEDFLVDDDAQILSRVDPEVGGPLPPFVLLGWDRDGSQRALEMNRKRVILYLRLMRDWRKYDLISRVKAVDLSDLNDPQALVVDSGEVVTISLGKGDFATGLQKGLETIAGKGERIKYVIDPNDENPIIGYRNS